jgi:hypothetical protein
MTITGSCLCGGVRFRVRGPLSPVVACHCTQCRKTSGHHVAATEALWRDVVMDAEASLRWYRSSDSARRGFCGVCGGNLFWERLGSDSVSIFAGTLDAPTGLRLERHIFVADKGDYYDVTPE